MDNLDVFGLTERHLVRWRDWQVHQDMQSDLQALFNSASANGFELGIASAFRGFDRQLAIWNGKARGERPVLDDLERPVELATFSTEEQVLKILRWSALPGGSRHHWGTDFDVFDAGATRRLDHQLQLTRSETENGGIFAEFYRWLDSYLQSADCAFFRPYAVDRGGVAPEPWHLSHKRLGPMMAARFSVDEWRTVLDESDLQLQKAVLRQLDAIYERFVRVPSTSR